MHGLLAISALHYGHIHPEKHDEYELISNRHQEAASSLFSSQLHNLNEHNCNAFVVLATLLFRIQTFVITDSHKRGRRVTTQQIVQSFMLSQGTKSIFSIPPVWTWVKNGPLSTVLDLPRTEPTNISPPGVFATQLDRLLDLARSILGSPDALELRSACILAVESLRLTYAFLCGAPTPRSDCVWLWPVTAPPRFLQAVGEKHPAALVVLAHYAVLTRHCEDCWVLEGWSEAVVGAVEGALEGEGWEGWVEWAGRCVREGVDVLGA